MKRMYIAYYGRTEFQFESEHRAGSESNMEDAKRRARAKFGRLHNTISGIHLRPDDVGGPVCTPVPKDLSLTEDEKQQIAAAISAGQITRLGAKLNGTMCVFSIKDAHGWSRRDLEQAIENEFFSGR